MASLGEGLQGVLNALDRTTREMQATLSRVEEMYEDIFVSSAPESRRMALIEDILQSPDVMELGIRLITQDQLWEKQVDRYGVPTPLYAPRTVKYKAKKGVPGDKSIRYTQHDTGAFYNEGIDIEVSREQDFFDFHISYRRDYFYYIPDDMVGLTEENERIFKDFVANILAIRQEQELEAWI